MPSLPRRCLYVRCLIVFAAVGPAKAILAVSMSKSLSAYSLRFTLCLQVVARDHKNILPPSFNGRSFESIGLFHCFVPVASHCRTQGVCEIIKDYVIVKLRNESYD